MSIVTNKGFWLSSNIINLETTDKIYFFTPLGEEGYINKATKEVSIGDMCDIIYKKHLYYDP